MIYPIRHKYLTKRPEDFYSVNTATGKTPVWFVWILAVLLLISAGVTYRVLASRLQLVADTPIMLPVSLNIFPTQIGNWAGKDVPISRTVQRVAGNDAFINRLYTNKLSNEWANIYIAYTARPRTMLGHKPEVCYVGGGWIHDSTQPTELISHLGRKIPCLLHRFHWPTEQYQEQVVLNFYIVNGQLTSDESVFSGVGWRTPNIAGDPARYVAQVQISSVLENPVLTMAKNITDLVLDYFPDENGKVRAVEYNNVNDNILK